MRTGPGLAFAAAAALLCWPRAAGADVALGRFPVGAADLHYEIAIADCRGHECPIEIRLVRGRDLLDRGRTGWSMTPQKVEREAVTPGWGAGDPLSAPASLRAWASGEDEAYRAIAARPIVLASGLTGLLLDMRGGFEHLKQHHELWLARAGELERVWQHRDGAGPTWSSTAIVAGARGSQNLVLFAGDYRLGMDEPDDLQMTSLAWRRGALRRQPPPAVWSSVGGEFDTALAARKAVEANAECLAGYWVLPGRQVGARAAHVLALPSLSRAAAELAAQRARRCRVPVRGRVVRLAR